MSTYTPDCWKVLEFDYGGESIKKVFAGWYGGFANGDSWKLSSGITETKEFDDRFEFDNHSGSIYVCFKGCEKMSFYMTQVFSSFTKEVNESEGRIKMEVIDYD